MSGDQLRTTKPMFAVICARIEEFVRPPRRGGRKGRAGSAHPGTCGGCRPHAGDWSRDAAESSQHSFCTCMSHCSISQHAFVIGMCWLPHMTGLTGQQGSAPWRIPRPALLNRFLTMRPSSSAVALAESNAEQHFLDRLARETPRLSGMRWNSRTSGASPARVPSLHSLGQSAASSSVKQAGAASRGDGDAAADGTGCDAPVVALAATLLKQGISNMVDDSFNRCFEETFPDPWNWNVYLYPAWLLGVVVRYLVLFPARLLALLLGNILFFLCFMVLKLFPCLPAKTRIGAEQW